jgi:16S rRNA (guanine966-N2)-methyltransferase
MARRERKAGATTGRRGSPPSDRTPVGVRIIGGRFRGRKLIYSGDLRTRPMKDRLREAVFNLLGPDVRGKHAIDLFAGTGALAFEALSRGAARATLIEQHFPTAEVLQKNAALLGVEEVVEIVGGNVFIWARRLPQAGALPWVVFCSPPYRFYTERAEEMLQLIGRLLEMSPVESILVVEADGAFDFAHLPEPETWDMRSYPPAVIGIYRE